MIFHIERGRTRQEFIVPFKANIFFFSSSTICTLPVWMKMAQQEFCALHPRYVVNGLLQNLYTAVTRQIRPSQKCTKAFKGCSFPKSRHDLTAQYKLHIGHRNFVLSLYTADVEPTNIQKKLYENGQFLVKIQPSPTRLLQCYVVLWIH